MSGSRPSASTWTEWPKRSVAVVMPDAASVAKVSSVPTSQITGTSSAGMPPPLAGSGASRVHRMTLLGRGSPDATPSVKGLPGSTGAGGAVLDVGAMVVVDARARRSCSRASSPLLHTLAAPTPNAARNPRREMSRTGARYRARSSVRPSA